MRVREILQGLFGTSIEKLFNAGDPNFSNDFEGLWHPIISQDENDALFAVPNEEEVKKAVFSMGSYKASGLDGFSPIFYKHYWVYIKADVIAYVQRFFTEGYMLKQMSHTFIRLIPKFQGAAEVKHF